MTEPTAAASAQRFLLRDGRAARIRPATPDDAAKIVALGTALAADGAGMVTDQGQVRDEPAERRKLEESARTARSGRLALCLVAELEGTPEPSLGLGELRQLEPARCTHVGIVALGVHPTFQRQGIGRALFGRLVALADAAALVRLELYVRADNHRAQALYREFGFVHEGTRERFVRLDDGRLIDDYIFARFKP